MDERQIHRRTQGRNSTLGEKKSVVDCFESIGIGIFRGSNSERCPFRNRDSNEMNREIRQLLEVDRVHEASRGWTSRATSDTSMLVLGIFLRCFLGDVNVSDCFGERIYRVSDNSTIDRRTRGGVIQLKVASLGVLLHHGNRPSGSQE